MNPFGTYQDSFATNRALANAKLSGDWHQGAWRLSPSADVTYFQEQQFAFTSVTGVGIPGQTLALGRLSVGPEVGYSFKTANGTVFEPYGSVKLLWDFKRDTTISIGGMDVGTEALRARAELGASVTAANGISLKAGVGYDGVGDGSYHAIEGKLSVHMPLQ